MTMRPKWDLSARVGIGGVAFAVFLVLAAGAGLWLLRQQLLAESVEQMRRLSVVFAEQTERVIVEMDRIILETRQDLADAAPRDAESLHRLLRNRLIGLPQGQALMVFDAKGDMVAHSREFPTPRINVADRAYFRAQQRSGADSLFISEATRNRVNGRWMISLSRPASADPDRRGGVIMAAIEIAYFTKLCDLLRLPDGAEVLLQGDDGKVRMAFPNHDILGQPSPILAGARHGDGRISSIVHLPTLPLTVAMSMPMDAALGDWTRLAWGVGVVVVVTILIVAMLTMLLRGAAGRLQVQSDRMAQMNQDLEQFTQVLAHHLQEPARLQHAFSQRLAKLLPPPLSPDVGQALQFVMDAALRQRALLRDVQLYLSLGKLPPPSRPCRADAALDLALGRLGSQIAAAAATIERGPLPEVMIDPGRLTDLFAILLDNAITYRRPDVPPLIRVEGDSVGGMALLSVSDNGIGIAEEFRTRVFRVFERLDPRPGQLGTGIGLALAKKIVESVHGRIWIEDSAGTGIRICFTIPRQ